MKMVVVKSPKLLAGIFRIIFRIKKEPADDIG
ncbi:MAG: stage V sporulation protein SpoVM [Ruminococcus sp.]|nr:stage V sporulation protein SpoVM [Ruminococcus sp.]